MPTPTPPIQRKKINDAVDHASPQPTEQAREEAEATTKDLLAPEPVAGGPGHQAAEHRADHRRTDEPTFHQSGQPEMLDNQVLGAGDDEQVVAEQQPAQRRSEAAEAQIQQAAAVGFISSEAGTFGAGYI